MKERRNKGGTLDYVGLAVRVFRTNAGGAWEMIRARQLDEDWRQEIELAAFLARREGLSWQDAARLYGRLAYAALMAMGFWRPRGPGRRILGWTVRQPSLELA
jgi:hypothetical protein